MSVSRTLLVPLPLVDLLFRFVALVARFVEAWTAHVRPCRHIEWNWLWMWFAGVLGRNWNIDLFDETRCLVIWATSPSHPGATLP